MTTRQHTEMPRQVERDRAGTDPSASAGDDRHLPAEHAGLVARVAGDNGGEVQRHLVASKRLWKIFAHAEAARQRAIEVEVDKFADREHDYVGLDHLGQMSERSQRLFLAA